MQLPKATLTTLQYSHRTHDLINQQRAFLRYEFDIIRAFLEGKVGLPSPCDFIEDAFAEGLDSDLKSTDGRPPPRYRLGSGTLFSITFSVDVSAGEKPLFYPARAKYDTGCPDCLISESIVRKHHLESSLESFKVARRYTGLGNFEVTSTKQICLIWSVNNETVSRKNTFFVVADSPFELLLGENFMLANSPMLPALPIRLLHDKNKGKIPAFIPEVPNSRTKKCCSLSSEET